MWIEERNGKYIYRMDYLDPSGKTRVVSVTLPNKTRATQTQAEEALKLKIQNIYAKYTAPEDVTLKQLLDKYIDWKYANLKEQTAYSNGSLMKSIISKIGENERLNALTARKVKDALDAPPTTYNIRITRFKSLMRWAYQNEYTADISFIDKLTPKKAPTTREKNKLKYLEHDEIKTLLANFNEQYALLTEWQILTGMRIGETIGLETKNVDVQNREIHIEETYSAVIGKSSSVKTESSHRTIYIQDELIPLIKKIDARRMRIAMNRKKIISLFFPSEWGNHADYSQFRSYFADNTEKLIGRKLTPHSLRHTHTALLAEAGIPLEEISRRLGHSDSKTTKDVYFHVTDKLKEQENERLKGVKLL